MKKLFTCISIVILLITNSIYSQDYNKNAFLKDYSGEMIITTQVRGERNKAILRGTEANKNRAFVLKTIQEFSPLFIPLGMVAFGQKEKPNSLEEFEIETKYFDELVNWGIENEFHIMHHCLIFPNKYFPSWFLKQITQLMNWN